MKLAVKSGNNPFVLYSLLYISNKKRQEYQFIPDVFYWN